ncbi:MAG: Gfo/Idh/MocA family oxidoreductase [Bacteroidota bacterium]
MKKTQENSRRNFLKTLGLTAGSFYIVPRHVLGGKGFIAPSDKVNIAGIGCGGKGWSDLVSSWNNGAENIVALCDVDFNVAAKAAEKWPNAKKYSDFRELLEKEKGIDAVTISTPDHTHATIAMAAMQLGKHVYVQKPLTHNIYEARMLAQTAMDKKIVSQMGNQGSSGDGVRKMQDWYNAGVIGKVSEVHVWTNRPVWPQGIPVPSGKFETPAQLNWDMWLGPAAKMDYNPAYHPFKWRGWWAFGTGALGDMGCHLLDPPMRVLGLGSPTEVECSVGSVFLKDWNAEYIPEGCPPSSIVNLKYGPSAKNKSEVKLTWYDGGLRPPHPDGIDANVIMGDDDGTNGVIMIGSKGIMLCGTYGRAPKVFIKGKQVPETELPAAKIARVIGNADGHQTQWVSAIKAGFGNAPLSSSFDYSGPFTESVLMGNLAIRSYMMREGEGNKVTYPGRKKLLWDGANLRITNFEPANQFVKREYREGWHL